MWMSLLVCALSPFVQAPATCTPSWIPTFGGEPGFEGGIGVFATFDDGTGPALYGGGAFTSANGHPLANIAKWDGTLWTPLGAGVDWNVNSLCVFDDGTGPALYVGGWFSNAGGAPASRIARWDGHAWSPLNAGLDGAVNALVSFDDGTGPALYVGGAFTHADGIAADHVAKWNGSSWSALGAGLGSTTLGNKQVYALTVFDDGNGAALYAGGRITHTGTMPISIVSKWDGSTWHSVGNQFAQGGGSFDAVTDMRVFDDGTGPALYACGAFSTLGPVHIRNLARWNGSVWSGVGPVDPIGGVGRLTEFDFGNGPELIASGQFHLGPVISGVARWNGSNWSAFVSGVPTEPGSASYWAFGVFDDGTGPALFVAGNFLEAGGIPAKHIAKWKNSTWSALGSGAIDHPSALAVLDEGHGPTLHAGFLVEPNLTGSYVASWNGSTWERMGSNLQFEIRQLVQFDSGAGPEIYVTSGSGVMRWNGSSWASMGGIWTRDVGQIAVFDDGHGPTLYAGGSFTANEGAPSDYLAKWNGTGWSPVTPELNGEVAALAVLDLGHGPELYVGGPFTQAGTVSAAHVARWDGTSWTAFGSGLDYPGLPPTYAGVNAFAKFDTGSGPALYVTGSFWTAGGNTAANIAKWDGTQWSPLGVGLDDVGTRLCVFDDGSGPALFASGRFLAAGGSSSPHIARWDGSNWSSLGLSNTYVGDMTVFDAGDQRGNTLVIGGTFDISPASDSQIARFGGCSPSQGTPFCFGDGSGTACPCGNDAAAGHMSGCLDSLGMGARLTTSGSASVTHDTLVLVGAQMPNSAALYFQGTTRVVGGLGAAFGDGLRCAGGTMTRLGVTSSSGGTSHYPTGMDAPVSVRGVVSASGVRTYQAWYRNAAAFCTSATFNLTNGIEIAWHP